MERLITEVVTTMNKQWSAVTSLQVYDTKERLTYVLTYVFTMFSINCLLNAISSCRLFEQ